MDWGWLTAIPMWGVQVAAVVLTASSMAESGALPALQTPKAVLGAMVWVGGLANPDFTPIGFLPLAIAGVLSAGNRRGAAITVVWALVWIGTTGVDLTEVSVPRLHTGAVLLTAPLVGLGWEALLARRPSRGVLALTLSIWTAGIGWSAWQNFRPVNEDAEEELWRDAIAALPDDTGCLLAMGYGDPPDPRKTARHNPTYLLSGERGDWWTGNLSDANQLLTRCPGPTYALIGVRCYAALREPPGPAPEGADPHPVCLDILRRADKEVLFERDVTNHGDLAYEMYPAGGPLKLGLYRLDAPAP